MDFNLPADLTAYLAELDRFIEREIKPLEAADDNIRFFDHRREWAHRFRRGRPSAPEWAIALLLRGQKQNLPTQATLRSARSAAMTAERLNLWIAVIAEHATPSRRGSACRANTDCEAIRSSAPLPIVTVLGRLLWNRRAKAYDRRLDHRRVPHHARPHHARARLRRHAYGGQGGPRRDARATPVGLEDHQQRRYGPQACMSRRTAPLFAAPRERPTAN